MGELITLKTKERVSDVPLSASADIIVAATLALRELDQHKVYSALGAEFRKRDSERDRVVADERRLRLEEAERLDREKVREIAKLCGEGTHFIVQVGPFRAAVRKDRAASALLTIIVVGAILLVVGTFMPTPAESEARRREYCGDQGFGSPDCEGY